MSEPDHVVPSAEPVKRRQHIRPRKADETVCTMTGLNPKPEGLVTSNVRAEIACEQCRVGADLLQEAGDLLINAEGRWELDDRPEEFRSIYRFIGYLGEDERTTFTLVELQELVRYTKASFKETRDELQRLGFRMKNLSQPRAVRGIGRLKPLPRGA
jgi:hypothetical protein